MTEQTRYLTEQHLTAGSEIDRRLFLTRELYQAMEHLSFGRPAVFHIYDMVPTAEGNGQKEAVRISVLVTVDENSGEHNFQVELPQSGNEVAIFLHANELYQFLQAKLQLPKGEITYVPKQSSDSSSFDDPDLHQVHLPLTFRPDTKNYVILGRDENKYPGVTLEELAYAHRSWLDEVYGDTAAEFPQIDVLAYSKKNGVRPNEVQFRRTVFGQTELGEHDVYPDEARKLWQTYSLPTLQVLANGYNDAL